MCFRVHTTLERFSLSLSLCERSNGGVYLQHTIAPDTGNGGVCARSSSLSSRTRTYVDSVLDLSIVQRIVFVCVCVCMSAPLSLSLSLVFSLNGGVCVCPHPRSPPPFPSPLPLYPSLSLSLYLVLPHVSYPTCTCFSHPIPICGHRTVKAPYPVRSAKLSTVSTS